MKNQSGPFGYAVKTTLGVGTGLVLIAVAASTSAVAIDLGGRALRYFAKKKRAKADARAEEGAA